MQGSTTLSVPRPMARPVRPISVLTPPLPPAADPRPAPSMKTEEAPSCLQQATPVLGFGEYLRSPGHGVSLLGLCEVGSCRETLGWPVQGSLGLGGGSHQQP